MVDTAMQSDVAIDVASDVAIDLGTAATRLHARARNEALWRPSVAWRRNGERAALRGGVIVDPDVAADVLGDLLRRVRRRWRRPRVLACIPTDASGDEREALVEAVRRGGAASVSVVPEPLAAAIGAGRGGEAPCAVVDIGEGVTDCAVIREGRVVASGALRVAVADLRDALRVRIDESHGIRISRGESERVLREIGVAPDARSPRSSIDVIGKPSRGEGPVHAGLEIEALHAALAPTVDRILAHVGAFFAELPDDLAEDVRDQGVCLTGGGTLLRGMLDRAVGELAMAVLPTPDPLRAVVDGARELAFGRRSRIA
ncbi:MAG: rod shape-determining protein [Myxococcota bacterium]